MGAAAGLLLLVLLRHLGRLAAHLPGASERSVHLTHVDGGEAAAAAAASRARRRSGGGGERGDGRGNPRRG